jgi:ubiquinone/menaquinone biosynthesis C-methylase UbiE
LSEYVPALRYRWLTSVYDLVVGVTTREAAFKTALVQQASPAASSRVLDVACGTGTLAILLKSSYPEADVTGIDGDAEILRIAERKARRAKVQLRLDHGLSYELPYADASFDFVLSSLFFHHLSRTDKLRTAREMNRVLRPSGELHVVDWGPACSAQARVRFRLVQMLDGFVNTQDNADGLLPGIFREACFRSVHATREFATVFGTLVLYRGHK